MSEDADKEAPIQLKEPLVLLCEGEADRQFFRKLTEKRPNMPKFDIPFPSKKLFGNSAYRAMLDAIRGDRLGFRQVKGVLIVADATAKPTIMFQAICKQIRSAGEFAVPTASMVVETAPTAPGIAVMLMPPDAAGALETVLVEEILQRDGWINKCVSDFLKCDKIKAHGWSQEKLDKARFQSMIAALNEDDPTKAASRVFKDPKPVIDVKATCFDHIADYLKTFSATVGVSV